MLLFFFISLRICCINVYIGCMYLYMSVLLTHIPTPVSTWWAWVCLFCPLRQKSPRVRYNWMLHCFLARCIVKRNKNQHSINIPVYLVVFFFFFILFTYDTFFFICRHIILASDHQFSFKINNPLCSLISVYKSIGNEAQMKYSEKILFLFTFLTC